MLTLKHSLILLTLTLATDNGLRIPIRGYENEGEHPNLLLYLQLRIPIRGYEYYVRADAACDVRLRIPIRGYEHVPEPNKPCATIVTNPYKGL